MGGSAPGAPSQPSPWSGPTDVAAGGGAGPGPTTPAGGAGPGPGPGPAEGPSTGGPYITKPRGPTTRAELRIDWDCPVPPRTEGASDRTHATPRRALPYEEALALIRGDDPRPLLVLRECIRCTGTEDALMARMEDNEPTFLMSRWFHCVKLPPAVIEPDHPFHALFAGEKPAHLFVSRVDGSQRQDLGGPRSHVGLWKSMKAVLASEYRGDPERALLSLSRLLDRFDDLDERILGFQRQIELAMEAREPDKKEIQKLRRELTDLCAKRDELREQVAQVSKLTPLQPEPRAKKAG